MGIAIAEGNILLHMLLKNRGMGQEEPVEQPDISKPAVSAVPAWGPGDAAAALIGKKFGRHPVPVRRRRAVFKRRNGYAAGSLTDGGPSQEQSTRRKKTLRTSLILNAPGPLAIGIAVLSSCSTTQTADFIRRGMEPAAVFISSLTCRGPHGTTPPSDGHRARMERSAGLRTAGAMICTGSVLMLLALSRMSERGMRISSAP